jgi:YHS domain-containing protein
MSACTRCSSMAINPHCHSRLQDIDLDLCDVCYWRKRAEPIQIKDLLREHGAHKSDTPGGRHWYFTSEERFHKFADDPKRVEGAACHGQTAELGRWYVYVYAPPVATNGTKEHTMKPKYDELVDAIYKLIPYMEEVESDETYKPGVVKAMNDKIKAMLEKATA